MGVEGLYRFINKNLNDVFTSIDIYNIRGQSCIIDGIQHIYSQLIYLRSKEKEIITVNGKNISHIHGLLNSLTYYLKNGIIPIFIFDGKSPEIKKNKIDERKNNLKINLEKLKVLLEQKKKLILENNFIVENYFLDNIDKNLILEDENYDNKMINVDEEYKKIYKKSIILKDYYIKDWIQILELLGIPVIKAEGEADPLCAYLLKNNHNIFGIISDDSDMLIFGAPILMRKSYNKQFTIIKLDILLKEISLLLEIEYNKNINFNIENLIDFSILLGTDYGNFIINKNINDSLGILKYYVENDLDFKKIISEDQYEKFENIKNYYMNYDFNLKYNIFLEKPVWNKPNFLLLKKLLLELNVDEDYIDKNNEYLNISYNKMYKYNNLNNNKKYSIIRNRSNSVDVIKNIYNCTNNL